jgi:large subunit ribosomal protein L23
MAIFGFKKRKDEKLEQAAQSAKSPAKSTQTKGRGSNTAKTKSAKTAKGGDVKAVKAVVAPKVQGEVASHAASIIIRPRITEKSGVLSQSGVYTFEVAKNANKEAVSKAVNALYKIVPVKVAIINTPTKNVFVKNRRGTVSGIKKAIITVKKGDKIEFV